jgi:hypothetical protein
MPSRITNSEAARMIVECLVSFLLREPPVPMVLAGTIMRETGIRPAQFHQVMGNLIEKRRVVEFIEGKKRYYFLREMVVAWRERRKD